MLVTILKRLGLGALIGARIGVTVALFVLMVRWVNSRMNYVRSYYVKRIHSAYHLIQMEVLHIHHEMQFKVLRAHHGIQVEVLYAHRRWLILNGTLTFGELIKYSVTLIVGAFAWKRVRARYALTQYNAARERKRHESQVRGVARLVLGELAVINTSIERALAEDRWHWLYPLPRNAWERDGALIAESLSDDEAAAVIKIYTRLDNWKTITAQAHQEHPDVGSLSLHPEHKAILGELQDLISDASWYLRKLGYPSTYERDRRLTREREFLQQRIERLERGSAARLRSVGLRS